MRILDQERYWAFLKAYLICFIALVGLYIVIDAFTNFDEFREVTEGTAELFRYMGWYYLVRLSPIFDRLSGVMTMMAAIFTVTWMQKNNELLAMLAAGISTHRVIRPVVISAVLVNVAAIFNQEYVIPRIGGDELQRSADDDGQRKVIVTSRFDVNSIMIHGKDGDRGSQTITAFSASLPVQLFGVGVEIEAKHARYIPDAEPQSDFRGGWLLLNATITPADIPLEKQPELITKLDDAAIARLPAPYGKLAAQSMNVFFLRTNLSFASVTRNRHWFQFAPTVELLNGLSDPANEPEKVEMAVFLHARLLRPLMSLSLLCMTLPLVLGGDGRNMFINLGLSLATSGLFYGVCFFAQFLGNNSVLSPEITAWGPLIAFATFAVARWDRIRT